VLQKELVSLEKSAELLRESYEKCESIGIKNNYSHRELEAFEALTARFSRLSDLIIQKIFRLIDTLELTEQGTVLDRINRAEKKGLIDSAKTFTSMRLLRNLIVHEYEPDAFTKIFPDVLLLTSSLLEAVESTKRYCSRFQPRKRS
jgi:uncharacterized protein YutE (UPF0331/DUF86 family)